MFFRPSDDHLLCATPQGGVVLSSTDQPPQRALRSVWNALGWSVCETWSTLGVTFVNMLQGLTLALATLSPSLSIKHLPARSTAHKIAKQTTSSALNLLRDYHHAPVIQATTCSLPRTMARWHCGARSRQTTMWQPCDLWGRPMHTDWWSAERNCSGMAVTSHKLF